MGNSNRTAQATVTPPTFSLSRRAAVGAATGVVAAGAMVRSMASVGAASASTNVDDVAAGTRAARPA